MVNIRNLEKENVQFSLLKRSLLIIFNIPKNVLARSKSISEDFL